MSRTRKAEVLAQRLAQDGYQAKAFHGQMDKQEKTENQDVFMRGEIQIMVATSAFGMGVDKKDVGLVIHYDISILARNAEEAIQRIYSSSRFSDKQKEQATRIIKKLISSKSKGRSGDEEAEASTRRNRLTG